VTVLQIAATVREKNQLTIPRQVAERHGIEPGRRLVIVDTGVDDEFTVRILPSSFAGTLAGIYGRSTDENVAYVRREREAWD
jgi:bifunctional DNA-binding transcriptional regulator/antitoxin component of YhaV-PrlF toxin-antitoxin module